MQKSLYKGASFKRIVGNICFVIFGVTSFSSPLDRLNPYNIGFGIISGFLFGWFFRKFLKFLLGIVNPSLKKDFGKKITGYAVDNGMLILFPFAALAFLTVFYFMWSMNTAFISTAIMSLGGAASIEIGKLKGIQHIKNTIVTSIVAFVFSYIWTLYAHYLVRVPGFIEGGIKLARLMLTKGGSSV